MTSSNSMLVRDLYAAFAAGDLPAVLGPLAPEVVWWEAENVPYADRNPYVGPQAVAEGVFGRIVTEWEGLSATPEEIVDGGDTVLAIGRYRGTYRASGLHLDAQFVHAWTLRDGQVVTFRQYTDTAQFARVCDAAVAGASA